MKINKETIYNKINYNSILALFIIFTVLALLGYIWQNEMILIICTFGAFILEIIYCAKDIKKNIIFLIFLMCFFTFIMGQYITKNNGVYLFWDSFPLNIRIHTISCVFLSLCSLIVGHLFARMIDKDDKDDKNNYFLNNDANKIKKISKYFFYITIAVLFIVVIEKITYTRQYGYLNYMANFQSKLPFIVNYIGTFSYVFMFIFLSTLPNKREMILPVSLYVVYLFLTILTGSRNTFVLGIINLLLYIIIREFCVIKTEKIITWKKVIAAVILLPIIIVSLNVYNTTRNGKEVNNINFISEINNFFANQGSSLAVISLGKQYEEQLQQKRYPYVFYSIVKEIESKFNNDIYSVISSEEDIEEKLYERNSLSTKISYLYYGDKITQGYGLGSNYIAEAYADGGYLGVIIINVLFGIIIYFFNKLIFKNWIGCTIILMITLEFMYVPRNPTFNWLNSLTAVNLWIGIGVMYYLTRKRKNELKE